MEELDNFTIRKLGGMAAVIKTLVDSGWVTVTPERQPYTVNLIDRLMPTLSVAGFTRVETPLFKVDGYNYAVCTRIVKAEVKATDNPNDLANVDSALLPILIEYLRKGGFTHIFSVDISRIALLGYLPLTCQVTVRVATVKP